MDTNVQEGTHKYVVADALGALPICFRQALSLHTESFLLWAPGWELSMDLHAGDAQPTHWTGQRVLWSISLQVAHCQWQAGIRVTSELFICSLKGAFPKNVLYQAQKAQQDWVPGVPSTDLLMEATHTGFLPLPTSLSIPEITNPLAGKLLSNPYFKVCTWENPAVHWNV